MLAPLMSALVAACSPPPADRPPADPLDPPETASSETEPSCDPGEIALYGDPPSSPLALYVPVVRDGAPAYLHLDSAGAYTLLLTDAPGWVDDAGVVTLACDEVHLPGYGSLGALDPVGGVDVIGYLGADRLLDRVTLLDVAGRRLRWDPPDGGPVDGGVDVPFDEVQGVMMVDATFDGVPVRLLVDTGSGDSLWLGVDPEPGDQPVTTVEALGDPLTVYLGTRRSGSATPRPRSRCCGRRTSPCSTRCPSRWAPGSTACWGSRPCGRGGWTRAPGR
jgi:hypothetical protein